MVVCGVVGIGTRKLGVGSPARSRFQTSVDRELARSCLVELLNSCSFLVSLVMSRLSFS